MNHELEKGDRVMHNVRGMSIVLEVLESEIIIANRGQQLRCGKQACHFLPRLEEIWGERSKMIRENWSEQEHRKRAGEDTERYEIPDASMDGGQRRVRNMNHGAN